MRRHFISNTSFAAFILHTASVSSAFAGTTLFVDASSGGVPDGTTWCTAFTELQSAIAFAVSGDEIRVAGGVYKPDQGTAQTPGDRTASFALNSGVVLLGGYAGCGAANPDARDVATFETILSGDLAGDDAAEFVNRSDNSYHVVVYDDPDATGVVLDGFTVRGGHADGTGPAGTMPNQGAGIHIRGGSLKCIPGGPTIRNCTIRDNWTAHHGAVNDHALATVIDNCVVRDNFAGVQAGGLLVHSGAATVTNCTFLNNVTDGDGGGVWIGHDNDATCTGLSAPTFTECRFAENEARGGGGGFFADADTSPVLSDCVLEANLSSLNGGGLHGDSSCPTVSGTSFINNMAVGDDDDPAFSGLGGGAWLGGPVSSSGEPDCVPTFTDCEFRGNRARVGGGLMSQNAIPIRTIRVHFEDNRTTFSGGAAGGLWVGAEGYIADCTFVNNYAMANGGGLEVDGSGRLTIVRCVFMGNTAGGFHGGGVNIYAATVSIANCWFIGNGFDPRFSAPHLGGGLLVNADASVSITNCGFLGNYAKGGGGAGVLHGSDAVFTNCTFFQNRVSESWRGASIELFGGASLTLTNSILWRSLAGDPQAPELRNGNTEGEPVSITYNCIKGGWPGIGNFDLDPGFVDGSGPDGVSGTADDDLRLSPTSPALNVGDASMLPADVTDLDGDGDVTEPIPLDLNGNPRIYGPGLDLGAFETSIILCEPGTFSATGEQPCDPCPAGEFQPNAGGTECLACAPGTFAATTGSAICSPCPAETFQPSIGAVTCAPCACDDSDVCTTNGCNAVDGSCENKPIGGCTVPTVSQWGILAMSLMLLTLGTIVMRRPMPT